MIDYGLMDAACKHYEQYNFKRIETPWTVSEAVDKITKPNDRISFQFKHNDKCFVASGEQSFLYLYLKETLPKGRFQTVTPCLRYDKFDTLHTKYFIKNELIETEFVNEYRLQTIIEQALQFFKKYIPLAEVVKTDIGFDIEVEGKELGSYGIRSCDFLTWIYGTGCAEPRTSSLIRQYSK